MKAKVKNPAGVSLIDETIAILPNADGAQLFSLKLSPGEHDLALSCQDGRQDSGIFEPGGKILTGVSHRKQSMESKS